MNQMADQKDNGNDKKEVNISEDCECISLPERDKLLRSCSSDVDGLGRHSFVQALEHPALRRLKSEDNQLETPRMNITKSCPPSLCGSLMGSKFGLEDDVFEETNCNNNNNRCFPGVTCSPIEEHMKDSLITALSGLYGILLSVIGSAVPISETFLRPYRPFVLEMFYIYLYLTCIVFLCYVYLFLLHNHTLGAKTLRRVISRSSFRGAFTKGTKSREGVSISDDTTSVMTNSTTRKLKSKKISFEDKQSNQQTGSFYLRLGALGFGIGSMVLDGLYFAEFFSSKNGPQKECGEPIYATKHFLKMIFTFTQLYFIFVNSKMKIIQHKIVSKFGLMHMTATNISVWVRTIVLETLHTIDETKAHHTDRNLDGHHNVTEETIGLDLFEIACPRSKVLGHVLSTSSPYLYPLQIEYSLICAGILFVMWQKVGKRVPRKSLISTMSYNDNRDDLKRIHRMSVDCSSSNRGLFFGLFTFVAILISLICFYTMLDKKEYEEDAVLISHITESVVYAVALITTICAAVRMRNLKCNLRVKSDKLEETLILVSLAGLYLFAIFSIVPAMYQIDKLDGTLSVVNSVFIIVQATFQTIFIMAGMRYTARNMHQVTKKPGREFVTFLLLTNFSIWMVNTLETQKPEHNKMQLDLFGSRAWSILVHVTVPLGIFYRFHSTVCLSHVWKNAWKMKSL